MNIVVLTNGLGLGGTEKAACYWANALSASHHSVKVVALEDGPRRADLDNTNVSLAVCPTAELIAKELAEATVVHSHAPGTAHQGDILGQALELASKDIPVVQTNIFGRLDNPKEDIWTDFRLFISWTSCVQAARRAGRRLDVDFFRRQSVAVYPVDLVSDLKLEELRVAGCRLREQLGVEPDEVLFGRFSRPEPNKWTDLPLDGFMRAVGRNSRIKLLLREPPSHIKSRIKSSKYKDRIIILEATSDADELQISQMACDVCLHGSSIGESFGYGIAELMALGKPIIVNSTPWLDQAQIELVLHGECGFQASTIRSTAAAVQQFAQDQSLIVKMGHNAKLRIEQIADPDESLSRVQNGIRCAVEGIENPLAPEDLLKAREAEQILNCNQFGHNLVEKAFIKMHYSRVCFSKWRKKYLPF